PPPGATGVLAGPQVSLVAVGGEHVTGVGGVGVAENGPKTFAEKPNCVASLRAGPLLWTAMVAPVTWLLPKFCRVNCHCRIPLMDWLASTASVFWGGPLRTFVSCASRLAPGPIWAEAGTPTVATPKLVAMTTTNGLRNLIGSSLLVMPGSRAHVDSFNQPIDRYRRSRGELFNHFARGRLENAKERLLCRKEGRFDAPHVDPAH